MSEIRLDVLGYPAPQGSKKAWVNKATGRAQMREQSGDKIQLWRQDVKAAARDYLDTDPAEAPWDGYFSALQVDVVFYFPRPKSHYRTGRNADRLRDNAPLYPVTRATGDIDKLCRATCDALVVAGMFADDSLIAVLYARKFYADPGQPGAVITLRTLDPCRVCREPGCTGACEAIETREAGA